MDVQSRSVPIRMGKMKSIKDEWMKIYTPIVEICKIQIRMNIKARTIEMRTCEHTEDPAYLERAVQYIKAINLGFSIEDSMAILKFNDVFLDHLEISEVKTLRGIHAERAIGRIIGREGKTKGAIEEFSKAKVLVKDQNVHILGVVEDIRIAKDAVCRLIMGSKPGSVFNRLRIINSRLKEKYGGLQTVYEDHLRK
ncbi:putative RNA-binding protein [Ordospora colligata]|uniref:Pre-rRNA-processing protein PNO1 n=1 Tax=Ordospora colligata OC4 TaxID=1354746 RepID=A0A0B2UHP7_9MICR|nr:putative RNA-binding protein [Ordospora colligata OC4]KHN68843.1 putative RNA-binding protein [Ordospora colligata OC4]TBU13877.1 putative RNA-binding protein [Ordospora colligata]TBU14066.1 putative RNA-binding protein [Ordospora colligata]TBU17735.1 putative RNA-binding protein [Ordospora colligata]